MNQLDFLTDRPFAHRGFYDNASGVPENSIPSFQLAIENGYAIELDVHLLKDGNIAVFHDDTLERMCGANKKISDLDSTTLQQYRLLGTEEKIPLFRSVLQVVNGSVPLLIEIKNTSSSVGALENALARELSGYAGLFAIQSFNPFSLAWFTRRHPHFIRGQLSGNFKDVPMGWVLKKLLQYLVFNFKSKPHFIAYDHRALPSKLIARLRKRGLPILAWTIQSREDASRSLLSCDNIIFENFRP